MSEVRPNVIRTGDPFVTLLFLLALAGLCLCVVTYLMVAVSASISYASKTSFENHYPVSGGSYGSLRKYALLLHDELDSERGARLKTLAAMMGALGILFLIWGMDRRRLTRKLEPSRTPLRPGGSP